MTDPNQPQHHPEYDPYGAGPQPGYPPPGPGQGGGHTPTNAESKGFFGALFDLSFRSFVTIKFASFIYVLLMVVIGLAWLVLTIAGFVSENALAGVLMLVLGGIVALVYLILVRIVLEFQIAMIRTAQNTAATRQEVEALRAQTQRL